MNISTAIKGGLVAAALCIASQAQAGNIPQYSFKETRTTFEFLTDATPVTTHYNEAPEIIFPNRQTLTAYTAPGFPIGFNFRFGGREFNQFAINNNGYLLLGNDQVPFYGYANLFFDDTSRYASNYFYLGLMPAMFSVAEGEISYKLEGTPGERSLTVQFAHLGVNEPTRPTRGNAIYSLQIVLFEKDGKVNINFLEEESPYTSFGLVCGLHGWSNADSMILTSGGLDKPATIADSETANMIKPGTLLHWSAEDVLGDGHTDPYCFSFEFEPTGQPGFVCEAPDNLSVEQHSNVVEVSCERPADAPATVILISENPILEFPEQGITYPVKNDDGLDYVTKFGSATMIYYSYDANPKASFEGVKPSTRYYIKAFGANGYPSYSTQTSADAEFFTSHPAPYVLQATSADQAINLLTVGDDDVIIATTLDRVNTSDEGMSGIFGEPEDNCKIGDIIEGGGEIIYIGAPGEFVYDKAAPNRQVFFRAWALRDGRVSKTYINASGVTNPEMPYEPQLELYTLYDPPLNWIAKTTNTSASVMTNFVPRTRGENDEPVIGGVSESTTSSLTSPTIRFGNEATLKFEWAMETARELPEQGDQMVQLPEGNEPGKFGQGHAFKVLCTSRGIDQEIFSTSEYTGTMTVNPSDADHYISGTSTFLPVEVKLPAVTAGSITFTFSTEGFSILYLRNITITSPTGVESIFGEVAQADLISGGTGSLSILSAKGGDYSVFTLDGHCVASMRIEAGEGRVLSLSKGIYVVDGRKVIVK